MTRSDRYLQQACDGDTTLVDAHARTARALIMVTAESEATVQRVHGQ